MTDLTIRPRRECSGYMICYVDEPAPFADWLELSESLDTDESRLPQRWRVGNRIF